MRHVMSDAVVPRFSEIERGKRKTHHEMLLSSTFRLTDLLQRIGHCVRLGLRPQALGWAPKVNFMAWIAHINEHTFSTIIIVMKIWPERNAVYRTHFSQFRNKKVAGKYLQLTPLKSKISEIKISKNFFSETGKVNRFSDCELKKLNVVLTRTNFISLKFIFR